MNGAFTTVYLQALPSIVPFHGSDTAKDTTIDSYKHMPLHMVDVCPSLVSLPLPRILRSGGVNEKLAHSVFVNQLPWLFESKSSRANRFR